MKTYINQSIDKLSFLFSIVFDDGSFLKKTSYDEIIIDKSKLVNHLLAHSIKLYENTDIINYLYEIYRPTELNDLLLVNYTNIKNTIAKYKRDDKVTLNIRLTMNDGIPLYEFRSVRLYTKGVSLIESFPKKYEKFSPKRIKRIAKLIPKNVIIPFNSINVTKSETTTNSMIDADTNLNLVLKRLLSSINSCPGHILYTDERKLASYGYTISKMELFTDFTPNKGFTYIVVLTCEEGKFNIKFNINTVDDYHKLNNLIELV